MEKYWLRGLLLGVSMALLLSGGVALAQDTVKVTVDQDCAECCTERLCTPFFGEDPIVPPEKYRADLTLSGLDTGAALCHYISYKTKTYDVQIMITLGPPLGSPTCEFGLWLPCGDLVGFDTNCVELVSFAVDEVGSRQPWELYGDWQWWVWQGVCGGEPPADAAHFTVLFAEECPVEAEFVPEPGSILLLGSGLAGLAGYATLRLRSGQALRKDKRVRR